MSGQRVVVVGGAGFVGSNLVRAVAVDPSARILVIDNLLSSNPTDVLELENVDFLQGSIADDAVLDKLSDEWDVVYHLSTYHGNQSSIANPIADHENNLLTTLKLFYRLTTFKRLDRVVYSSAGCTVAEKTFGEARATTEEDPVSVHLDSPYQISKIAGEMYAHYFHAQAGLPVTVARFQNVYGPGEILGAGEWRGTAETIWRNVTPTFIYRALKGMPIRLENGGTSTRDFIYVDDIVRGLQLCASKGAVGEIYNLASGVETSILTLAETISRQVDQPVLLEKAPARSWDRSGRRFGSTAKSERDLGFVSEVGIDNGIALTVNWTRSNLSMIEASVDRHMGRINNPLEPAANTR